ncbi:MAG: HepT-like ribonuclease domain-containing protein [Acidimicrobiales bacterium]
MELVGNFSAADLDADDLRRDAVLWNLMVLGEAASQISAELKEAHSELTWSDPIRLRNRLVHGYWSIEMEVVVDTASDDLSPLVQQLVAIQESLPDV